MSRSGDLVNAGPGRAGGPQTPVAHAVAHGGPGGPPGQWRRPTITRFGFDGTLSGSGSNLDGLGPDPAARAMAASASIGGG
jgi:hypothetical protein